MSGSEFVRAEVADRVLTLCLDRIDKRNALSHAMYEALAARLRAARTGDDVRVVQIAGSSDCFSSGNDLKDGAIDGLDGGPVGAFMRALTEFPKPVVAVPCGVAAGIGVTMLLRCDLVYAGDEATFRLPFVSLGVCPEFGSSWLLPRLVGHLKASALLLTGEAFDAPTAREIGLVNGLLPNAQVEEYARARAVFIAARPPQAVTTTKQLLKRARAPQVLDAISVETGLLIQLQQGAEAREALAAFREKRRPSFAGLG